MSANPSIMQAVRFPGLYGGLIGAMFAAVAFVSAMLGDYEMAKFHILLAQIWFAASWVVRKLS